MEERRNEVRNGTVMIDKDLVNVEVIVLGYNHNTTSYRLNKSMKSDPNVTTTMPFAASKGSSV